MNREETKEKIYRTTRKLYSLMRYLKRVESTNGKDYSSELSRILQETEVFGDALKEMDKFDELEVVDDDGLETLLKMSEEVCRAYNLEVKGITKIRKHRSAWKIYLDNDEKVKKVEYGKDKTKVQIIKADGTVSEVVRMGGEEYKNKGFAKKLLIAAGKEDTEEANLKMQEQMLDDGLYYINQEEGWIEKEKYFERMTPKDFLETQDYKDITVNAIYEDNESGIGKLTFYYTAGGKTNVLFEINASNIQKKREWPTKSGKNIDEEAADDTNPIPYIPGKFPKGNSWKIIGFEKSNTPDFGPYKIKTDAFRYVEAWEYVKDKGWQKKKDKNGKIIKIYDSGLLIHGGGWSKSFIDNKKGSNNYTDTTLGCIRISNLDVCLIVEILKKYLNLKDFISLEVK